MARTWTSFQLLIHDVAIFLGYIRDREIFADMRPSSPPPTPTIHTHIGSLSLSPPPTQLTHLASSPYSGFQLSGIQTVGILYLAKFSKTSLGSTWGCQHFMLLNRTLKITCTTTCCKHCVIKERIIDKIKDNTLKLPSYPSFLGQWWKALLEWTVLTGAWARLPHLVALTH